MNEQPNTAPEAAHSEQGASRILAEARQAQGLSLDDVANQLKFSTRQIEALEAGRFEQLPSGPFVRGMVRSYARLLNLDPAALLEHMSGAPEAADATRIAARFKQPVPFSDGSKRSSAAYVGLAVLALAIAAIVALQWRAELGRTAKPAPAAKAAAKPAPAAPAAAGATDPAPAIAAAPVTAPASPAPASAPAPAAAVPKAPAVQAAPKAPAVQAAPVRTDARGALADGRHRVGLRLDEESWIEITDGSGKTLVSQLVPAGAERTVVGEAPLSLVIGNAHRVHLTHNGKPVDLRPHIKVEVARLTLQ